MNRNVVLVVLELPPILICPRTRTTMEPRFRLRIHIHTLRTRLYTLFLDPQQQQQQLYTYVHSGHYHRRSSKAATLRIGKEQQQEARGTHDGVEDDAQKLGRMMRSRSWTKRKVKSTRSGSWATTMMTKKTKKQTRASSDCEPPKAQ